ncbi:acyl-CoA dehydrogenase family protein [Nocardioides marmoribigeumensis]|uniref:Acyl-CoA dehydrogenase n=1 Tax=Nocardioides marmoribigeumensis TaxID=433649 RepID=A0ABU2BYW4_9ACTN|nr:acyl-CoA dehydrogenase family protein [Nocardioides marmoribigeumensis]MDR7363591.1 acyl-CoA dehydrogenase [Nocardioides marmoribigeumensis]
MSFDLSLTPAQLDLVERAHAFAEDVVRPVAQEYDQRQEFPWPVLEEAAEQGFYNPLFYRDLIGDPTGLSLPLFMEELFWGCAGIGLAVVMPALALSAIGQAATPEQMLRWAPECFGEPGDLKLAALAISEPQGGSDVKNLRTTARRDGDDWIIDGHKMWIGNGGIADVHVVNASVDPELGHRGQAMFIVPGGTPGLELVRKLDKLGCRASHTAELRLDGVRLPGENLLGGDDKLEHKLAKVREEDASAAPEGKRSSTLGAFEQTRPMVAAQALGIARAALDYATSYANEREAFGAPIIDNQGISFALADLYARLDAARLMTWRASWMAAQKVPFQHAEGSMSKLLASELAVDATEKAIQVMGGWGYITDHPVEKWYRDAKLYTIFEGTSEIQRLIIGRTLGASATPPPPVHVTAPTDGPPLNAVWGRGTPNRTKVAQAALRSKDRVPGPIMGVAMKLLSPPGRK